MAPGGGQEARVGGRERALEVSRLSSPGRLIENMTDAMPIVECTHGAGAPQAQQVVVQRLTDWTGRRLAERIAGIEGPAP